MSNRTVALSLPLVFIALSVCIACDHNNEGPLVYGASDGVTEDSLSPHNGGWKGDDPNTQEAPFLTEGSPEALQVLSFVNDSTTTEAVLDLDVGLDRRAAYWIIRTRAGADQRYPSADDQPFTSIQELGLVNFVGQTTLRRLLTFVTTQAQAFNDDGAAIIGVWDGVSFTADEAAATLMLVNTASFDELDIAAAIKSDAAASIVNTRPFNHVRDLAHTSRVGEVTLTTLREYAVTWFQPNTPE